MANYRVIAPCITYPALREDAEYLFGISASGTVEERLAAVREVSTNRGGFLVRLRDEVVSDIPSFSVPWLIEQGVIIEVPDVGTSVPAKE